MKNGYEKLCHDTGVPRFMLGLRDRASAHTRGLLEPRLERAIGVIYRPESELASHYFEAVLPRQFDEYLWFDQTSLPRSPGGLIKADAQCRIGGFPAVYVVGDSGSFPGPDWMPKQAHMADLQGETAAANLLAELDGKTPQQTFKVELLCIVDSLDAGMLVRRTPDSEMSLPPLGLMHNAKAFFESWYLRKYR